MFDNAVSALSLELILGFLAGVSPTVWIFGGIVVVLLIFAAVQHRRGAQAELPEPETAPEQIKAIEDGGFEGIPEEIIAVISAAVAAALEGSGEYRIRSMKRVGEVPRSAWAKAGLSERTAVFTGK